MSATNVHREFDKDGVLIGGGQGFLPEYLDWMPIRAKAYWFAHMGVGNPKTQDVLLESQGEQLLIRQITLAEHTHKQYMEKERDAEDHTQKFIDREGISRTPRNQ